jgi:hypothetical protein
MFKKIFITANILLFLGIFIYLGKNTFIKAANCSSNCTQKEIGLPASGVGTFNITPVDPIAVNKDYWVKITVRGQDTITGSTAVPAPTGTTTSTTSGTDIMMMLDTTTSMYDDIPVNKDGSGGTVLTYEAVRDGLVKMVNLSDESKDYLGFGSFRLCKQYTNAATPIWWVYEDWNRADDIYRGVSALHLPLQSLNGKKQTFINAINSITILNDGSNNNFCRSAGTSSNGFNGGTSIGAALTAADTQLTPILNDPKAKRRDGTSYRDSTKMGVIGHNDGPRTRTGVPKAIILATDGGEGAPPTIDDQEIDRNIRTILQTATYYNIKIYGIAFSKPGNTNYQRLQRITGGNCGAGKNCIFSGSSKEEILNSIQAIRNEITTTSQQSPGPQASPSFSSSGSTVTLHEVINADNFTVSSINNSSTFKLIKSTDGSTPIDITSICGVGYANCIISKSSGGFDIKLPPIASNEQISVYFLVKAIAPSLPGQKVPVDKDPDSKVNYSTGHEENIRNTQVGIVANKPYFETQGGGDVHTAGGLLVDMPGTQKFIRGNFPGILSYSGSATVRPDSNQLSSKNWKVGGSTGYTINSQKYTYSSMVNTIKNPKTITALSQISGSGFYQYNGDLTISASNNLPNLKGSSLQIVLFVNGNVYIRTSIAFFGDSKNKSSLAVISSKNIGIGTTVKDPNGYVDGIYIADGVIDTACDATFIFNLCSPNSPNLDASSLTLQGMFLARAQPGFNLDRLGNPETPSAGEKFIYRPEMLLNAAPQLGSLSSVWREVSP